MKIKTLFRCCLLSLVLSFEPVHAIDTDNNSDFTKAYANYQQHINANDAEQALPYAQTAYALGAKIYGDDSANTAALAYNYGLNLLSVKDNRAALRVLKQTITHYEAAYGKDSFELIPVLMDAGNVSFTKENKAKSSFFKRAIKLANKHYGNDSIEYAKRNVDVGAVLFANALWRPAKRHLDTGYKILRSKLGNTAPLTGFAAFNLGKYEMSIKNNTAAVSYFKDALVAFEKGDGNNRSLALATHGFLVRAYEMLEQRDAATKHSLAIGKATPLNQNQDYTPLVKISPRYPALSLESRKEGSVIVEFDIDEAGFVVNPKIVALDGSRAFKKPSLEAVKKFRYAPTFKDGKPVLTAGVQTRFTFQLSSTERNRDKVLSR